MPLIHYSEYLGHSVDHTDRYIDHISSPVEANMIRSYTMEMEREMPAHIEKKKAFHPTFPSLL